MHNDSVINIDIAELHHPFVSRVIGIINSSVLSSFEMDSQHLILLLFHFL